MKPKPTIAGIVLAAGSSSRLGRPKQLVEFRGAPLVKRITHQLYESGCSRVTVVAGAESARIRKAVADTEAQVLVNSNWQDGMGSSLQLAVRSHEKESEAVVIALCDQPLIATEHYGCLIRTVLSGPHSIAASAYPNGKSGVPAAFSADHFPGLAQLSGDSGARDLIRNQKHTRIEIQGELLDIDTEEDLHRLQLLHHDR